MNNIARHLCSDEFFFTRANPSHDVHGFGAFTEHKHWGCTGPVIIDARVKPWHAPGLVEEETISERVDQLVF